MPDVDTGAAGDSDDRSWMAVALRLALRGVGRTGDNPSVGCVIVRDGRAVARARTADGGRPHAEAAALAVAGEAATGGVAYVSLEPCSHWGRTPPCAEALVEAGLARVVVAMEDPDPRVRGAGIAKLRQAGVTVTTGVLADRAAEVLAGYLSRQRRDRPRVTLKLATSLDGRIALADGTSRWVTGPEARARGHLLRARSDAILVGAATVRQDDPSLTCRLAGLEAQSPVRVVLGGLGGVDPSCALVRTAREIATWIVVAEGSTALPAALQDAGAEVLTVAADAEGRPNAAAALEALAARGIGSVLVEGGAAVAASLLAADLVDEVVWFRAAMVIGADGRPAIDPLGLADLVNGPRFERRSLERVGVDIVETLVRGTVSAPA